MGHINASSLKLSNKTDADGMRLSGGVSPGHVLRYREEHPATSREEVQPHDHHAFSASLGPTSPPARGGLNYISKMTDTLTMYKELYVIPTKREAVDTIQLYVQSVV